MDKELIWIEVGYIFFAQEGPTGLKVERLSKEVGKNKSSFYHLFADIDCFMQKLLQHHLLHIDTISEKQTKISHESELIALFVEHKMDLLFNRQLRIFRDNNEFQTCFSKVTEISKIYTLPLWKKIVGLNENHYLAELVYLFSIENFFLQITDTTLTEEWLKNYFESVKTMVRQIKTNKLSLPLDGTV